VDSDDFILTALFQPGAIFIRSSLKYYFTGNAKHTRCLPGIPLFMSLAHHAAAFKAKRGALNPFDLFVPAPLNTCPVKYKVYFTGTLKMWSETNLTGACPVECHAWRPSLRGFH
jgi:hypothetical protein